MIVYRRSPTLTMMAVGMLTLLARPSHAATYYVAMNGNDVNPGTMAAPFRTPRQGASVSQAGDTVYFRTGTHPGGIHPVRSGTATAWITFSAAPGELPILDGSAGDSAGFEPQSVIVSYIRVSGIAARNFGSSGFSNGWNFPSSHIEIRNCIAEGNGINGITFYGRTGASTATATGVLIQDSIIAHNGNQQPSWSSGVNIYQVGGTYQDNQVIGNVSFENIDISSNHSDGSGFILDFGSTGALFENNIGFRNGGSCLRVTNSSGAHLINNTCYHDGLDTSNIAPALPGEIYFSDAMASTNVVVQNNLLAAGGGMNAFNRTSGTGATFQNNVAVNANGATPFFTSPPAVDFRVVAASSTIIDTGSAAGAPATDIGFDFRCIKALSGQAVSWWQYAPDYVYIQTVGGVAGCFHPTARPQGAAPDIGAYEYGGPDLPGSGGSSGGGGATASGGRSGTAGAGGLAGARGGGGVTGAGGASANGGRAGTGGSGGGGVSQTGGSGGGPTGQAGAPGSTGAAGGTVATGGAPNDGGLPTPADTAGGCGCATAGPSRGGAWLGLALALTALATLPRRSRRRRKNQPLS